MPFETCWERIRRAYSHSVSFASEWDAFLKNNPYETHVTMDHDGTGTLWIERRFGELPAVFALELGEMLYQFRAALDACIYEAAILETGQDPPPDQQSLEFPVCATATQFNNSGRKIKPITDKHRRHVIESVQPYKTPKISDDLMIFNFNRTLGILNDWARKDRHRKLHIIGSWVSSADPQFRLPPGTTLDYLLVTHDGFLEHESEIASFKIGGWKNGMKLEANPDLYIDVAVDEPPPPCADNDTLSNRIRGMQIMVQMIVGEFEKSFGLPVGKS